MFYSVFILCLSDFSVFFICWHCDWPAKAQEDGLDTIKTPSGTGYWSTHHTATVGSREEFFRFCAEHNAWDMVESRASKTGVKSYIEANGAPPPGVNFSSSRVFNLRKAQAKD